MAKPLTAFVSPSDLADRREVIETEGEIADFDRIGEIVEAELRDLKAANRPQEWRATGVSIRLAFAWLDGHNGVPCVSGKIETVLPMVCQRCLEGFGLPISSTFQIAFVGPDGEIDDVAGVETWLLNEDRVRLGDLVEESLVMALPLAPVHPDRAACGPAAEKLAGTEQTGTRPFADLRSQMDKSGR